MIRWLGVIICGRDIDIRSGNICIGIARGARIVLDKSGSCGGSKNTATTCYSLADRDRFHASRGPLGLGLGAAGAVVDVFWLNWISGSTPLLGKRLLLEWKIWSEVLLLVRSSNGSWNGSKCCSGDGQILHGQYGINECGLNECEALSQKKLEGQKLARKIKNAAEVEDWVQDPTVYIIWSWVVWQVVGQWT